MGTIQIQIKHKYRMGMDAKGIGQESQRLVGFTTFKLDIGRHLLLINWMFECEHKIQCIYKNVQYILSQADSIEREDWEMLREER
jgi:hypothetical protein